MYKAKVVKISVKPHPNADRLQLGYVNGIQVIIGNDVKDGAVGVFFPCDGQLSGEFLSIHNLYRHNELNKDTSKRGYFSENGRVTAEKIRGENSDGFWCPLSYFEYTGYDLSKLKLGLEFDELNGRKICKKYYTPATAKRIAHHKQSRETHANYNLPRHFDTEQLQYNLDKIEYGDLVIITEKLHGTSTRIGYVKVDRDIKLFKFQKLYNMLPFLPKFEVNTSMYEFVVGTRNTIASNRTNEMSSEYYRIELAKQLDGLLMKGEVVYAEIVGFNSNGKPIMNQQSTGKLPEVKKKYGDTMMYTYGCAWNDVTKPQHKMFVYRITHVNEDGYETDLPWSQVKRRANQLGLECVPEVHGIFIVDEYYKKHIQQEIDFACTGQSTLDDSHIREGVCVRLEKADGTMKVYKHKSFEFKMLEGILKNSDDYIDLEEVM